MRTRSRLLAVGLVLAALASLASAQARPTVVVSIHPLYDLVRQVVGDAGDVERMLPIGASPHVFDPTPRDVVRVADADLVVTVGGIDAWLSDLLEAAGGEAVRLSVLELEGVRQALEVDFPDLKPQDARSVLAWNAHVWLDPRTMALALPAIADALAAVDPPNAAAYVARAEAVAADLRALDAELAATLAPVRGAPFVPFHDAWPYFAERYGLDLVVEIEPFPGREPSPAYLSMALGLIRASGAAAIFSEAQLNRRPAEVVADEAGVALFELDPIGGVDGRTSYQDLLRWNAAVLLEGLR